MDSSIKSAVQNIFERAKEEHFIILPYLFLIYFGNGLLFLWALSGFNVESMLNSFSPFPILIIFSILMSTVIYYVFSIISIFYSPIFEKYQKRNLRYFSFVVNYLYLMVLFTTFIINPESNDFFVKFIVITIILGFFSIFIHVPAYFLSKKEKNEILYELKWILNQEEIVLEFAKRFGKNPQIESYLKKDESKEYIAIVKAPRKKFVIVQRDDGEILEWKPEK